MTEQTKKIIAAVLKTDDTVSPSARAAIVLWITAQTGPQPDCILRRQAVAVRLGVKVKTVDQLAARGVLKKVMWPGAKRAAGFRESDVVKLIEEGGAKDE